MKRTKNAAFWYQSRLLSIFLDLFLVHNTVEKNVFGVLCSGCIPEGDPVSLHSPSSEDDDEADEEAASNQVWSLTQYYSVDFS